MYKKFLHQKGCQALKQAT